MENDEFNFEKAFKEIKDKLGNASESELRDRFKEFLRRSEGKLLIEMRNGEYHAEISGSHKNIVKLMIIMMEKNKSFKAMAEDAVRFFDEIDKKIKEN